MQSCDFLIELGAMLGQTIWRVTRKDEHDLQDSEFVDLTYGLLEDEEYELARRILEFGLSSRMKFKKPITRMISVVNLAQAYKWLGQSAECAAALKQVDFSITSEEFRLSDYVLRERYDDAAALMRRMGKDGPVKKEDYQSWPLFQHFRTTETFSAVFTDLFPPQTETTEIPKVGNDMMSEVVEAETEAPIASSDVLNENDIAPLEV
jgi:hypothetical protein